MAAQCCRGLAKGVKGSLLPTPGCPRRTRRLCLQRPVESLQPSVLLRVTRFDPLGHDTQLDPPYRQLRQATQAHAAKGRSVVGPNNSWESILSKGALKDAMRFAAVESLQLIADQQVARSGVLRRQRVDPGVPSLVRNQPLRSMNHTALGLSAAANDSFQCAAWRRRFRRRTSPARSRTSPAVLGAGHEPSGSAVRSHATTFFGPQFE